MEAADVTQPQALNHTHPLTPPLWVFIVLGGLAGLIIGQLITLGDFSETFLVTVCFSTFSLFLLIGKNHYRLRLIMLLLFNGMILLSCIWWERQDYFNFSRGNLESIFFLSAAFAIAVTTAFLQAWQTEKPRISYPPLFENAWNNVFIVKLTLLSTGAFLLVLLLGTSLFSSLNIEWPNDLIWNRHSFPIIFGTLFAAGVCISYRHQTVVFRVRLVVFALLNALAILTAFLVIAFILALPFTLDTLFKNNGTSPILLALTSLSILLLNTLTDKGSAQLPKWQNRLFMGQVALLPILPCISLYAINLRVQQYGLMPERIVALLFAVVLIIYSVFYLFGLLRRRAQWSVALEQFNPWLAAITLLVILPVLVTVIDPVKISINNQVSRLQSGEVNVEEFDFYAFKHHMGKPGLAALDQINSWEQHPQIARIRERIKKPGKHREQQVKLEIIPDRDLPGNMDTLTDYIGYDCEVPKTCFARMLPLGGKGEKYLTVFAFSGNKQHFRTFIYQHDGQSWERVKNYRNYQRIIDGQYEVLVDNIRKGNIEIMQPKFMDLRIDGMEIR